MKTKALLVVILFISVIIASPVNAENEQRNVPSFSEISLRISGTLHLKQGNKQSVEIVAKSSTLEDIITEVKDRQLIIRFPSRNIFTQNFNPGNIDIYITVPEVQGLFVSGSGDIIAKEKIQSRIIELTVSGSGDIELSELNAERVKTTVSGSGDIEIGNGGVADEFDATIAGSGNVNAGGFEAQNVDVRIAGSGNCTVTTNGALKARVAGSGNVYYKGNPSIDTSVAGSGRVSKM